MIDQKISKARNEAKVVGDKKSSISKSQKTKKNRKSESMASLNQLSNFTPIDIGPSKGINYAENNETAKVTDK